MMTGRMFLEGMKELFLTGHWTTGVEARDFNGRPVGPAEQSAVKFCLRGAEARALYLHPRSRAAISAAMKNLERIVKTTSLGAFNDSHTPDHIIKAIDDTLVRYYPPLKEESCQPEPVKAVKEKAVRSSSKSSKTSGKQWEDLFPGTNTPDPTMEPELQKSS